MWIVLAVAAIAVFGVLYEVYEHCRVRMTEDTIGAFLMSRQGKPADGIFCFCLITDLHNNRKYRQERLLEKIRAHHPTAILLAGDMVNKHREENRVALAFLEELAKIAPVFYSYGNHESELKRNRPEAWDAYVQELPAGCMLLDNETVNLWEAVKSMEEAKRQGGCQRAFSEAQVSLSGQPEIWISGLTLPENYFEKGKISSKENEKKVRLRGIERKPLRAYHILMAHNPEYAAEYRRYHADLIVSGHLHGGLVRLPLIGGIVSPRLRFPVYDSGRYQVGKSTLFVSRGLGSHTLPLRFCNCTELNFLYLNRHEQA